jgi:signal transduction histidine kinase
MALCLVVFFALALAVIGWGIIQAEGPARERALADATNRLKQQASELATDFAKANDLFPQEPRERYLAKLKDHLTNEYELENRDEIDASCDDWRLSNDHNCKDSLKQYDRREFLSQDNPGYDPRDFSFKLASASRTRDRYLYLFFRVFDQDLKLDSRNFNETDHLRVLTAQSSAPQRFVITLQKEGEVTTLQVGKEWQQILRTPTATWGNQRAGITRRPYGRWERLGDGYQVELRLPLLTLEKPWAETELGLAVVDFDGEDNREPSPDPEIIWVVPIEGDPTLLRSPDSKLFQAALEGLDLTPDQREIAVIDNRGRILLSEDLEVDSIADILHGWSSEPGHESVTPAGPSARVRGAVLEAIAPVTRSDGVKLGTLVERLPDPTEESPALQSLRRSMLWVTIFLSLVMVALVLLLIYASSISRRILALINVGSAAVDSDDEIGALEKIVERDRVHGGELKQLANTLKHEISGRLNTINMAIDGLPLEDFAHQASQRAVVSIQNLIRDFGEAANLEQALASGERIDVDLVDLIRKYDAVDRLSFQDAERLVLDLPDTAHPICLVEDRIEELLDKLVENARSFSEDGIVSIDLKCTRGEATIGVSNTGSQLPRAISNEQLFSPTFSGHDHNTEGHLGLGLFVARVIAEQHGGRINARNDGPNRVVFEVTLRSARAKTTQASTRP